MSCIEPGMAVRDDRGMAIKLMGVSGEKLLGDEKNTQDFCSAADIDRCNQNWSLGQEERRRRPRVLSECPLSD
jgi:hypothetical protein